jgi:hypothetical protein
MGDRYEMENKCAFVDAAEEHDHKKKKPKDIQSAHVMDQRPGTAKVLKLNDTAGFIARFIVQGVDIDVIPQILTSEYGSTITNPKGEVDKVLAMLKPYVKKRSGTNQYSAAQAGTASDYTGTYELDFKINWFAIGWIKF